MSLIQRRPHVSLPLSSSGESGFIPVAVPLLCKKCQCDSSDQLVSIFVAKAFHLSKPSTTPFCDSKKTKTPACKNANLTREHSCFLQL